LGLAELASVILDCAQVAPARAKKRRRLDRGSFFLAQSGREKPVEVFGPFRQNAPNVAPRTAFLFFRARDARQKLACGIIPIKIDRVGRRRQNRFSREVGQVDFYGAPLLGSGSVFQDSGGALMGLDQAQHRRF
jgi:hypothetical protein